MGRAFSPVLFWVAGLVWLAMATALVCSSLVQAKAPGKRHCYRSVCVNVLTIPEVRGLLGKTVRMTASHYGDPSVDPFNRGTYTSNGERFDANDPTRTASATLPDGTELLLRNPDTGAVSHVRVNDFGPFWVNRELDVTERVARDLGFEKQGIKALEVTIVSVPTTDDVKRLYRHDRPPLPAMGFLGKRTAAETAKLAQVLMRRADRSAETNSKVKATEMPGAAAVSRRVVVQEQVYHFVPKQAASPRALGAEDMTPAHVAAGAAALARWNETRRVRAELNAFAFLLLGVFAFLAFVAPHGAPLLMSGARRTHRLLTYDDALEHLKTVLAQEHPTAPTRLAHGRLLRLPAPQAQPIDEDFEAEVFIAKAPDANNLPDNVTDIRDYRDSAQVIRRMDAEMHVHGSSARFEDVPLTVAEMKLPSDRSTNGLANGYNLPKKVARIVGEGVCHEGDLSSADAIIISGQVIGNVASAQVTIEPTGVVDGSVEADWVKVEGWVNGSIVAEKVDLEAAALVSGDVQAKLINAAEGALIEGQCVEVPLGRAEKLTNRLQRA